MAAFAQPILWDLAHLDRLYPKHQNVRVCEPYTQGMLSVATRRDEALGPFKVARTTGPRHMVGRV